MLISDAIVIEIFKIFIALLSGGLAGALVNEWFRRRNSRIHKIPLIERVNREVSTQLHGITLARIIGDPNSNSPQLEKLANLREYQLTLQNTSPIHLQNVEIQFEFPVEDSQAWVSRPLLSKTSLIEIDSVPTLPWKKSFRWQIPHFPSRDSVEFTFQAVNPSSHDYEVSLYQSERVIVEKVIGESVQIEEFRSKVPHGLIILALAISIAGLVFPFLPKGQKQISNKVTEDGCELRIISVLQDMTAIGTGGDPAPGPLITNRVFNIGKQTCILQSAEIGIKEPISLIPGQLVERTQIVGDATLAHIEILAGMSSSSAKKAMIEVYVEK